MTQEDKSLLLKDLCARLPYGVKCRYQHIQYVENGKIIDINMFGIVNVDGHIKDICDIKPYLIPLSSMTETQCYELAAIRSGFQDCWKYIKTPIPLSICNFEQIDWFHKNHFDYRGLIEKGLAIDATNLNIY